MHLWILSLNLKPLRIKNIKQNIMEKLHMLGLLSRKDAPHGVQKGRGAESKQGYFTLTSNAHEAG